MESYHYVNIFETKGLEYLLLISFLVLLLFLIRYLAGPTVPPTEEARRNRSSDR